MPKINAIVKSNIHAAKLKGTNARAGKNNTPDNIHLLVNFGLSGANIAPIIAANIIDALNQQIQPTIIKTWDNIPKYILKQQ